MTWDVMWNVEYALHVHFYVFVGASLSYKRVGLAMELHITFMLNYSFMLNYCISPNSYLYKIYGSVDIIVYLFTFSRLWFSCKL